MKPDFVSPMTMCKTAWRFASDDLSPAFSRRSFSAPKNHSANIARPLYRFLSADDDHVSVMTGRAFAEGRLRSGVGIGHDSPSSVRDGGPRLSPIRF